MGSLEAYQADHGEWGKRKSKIQTFNSNIRIQEPREAYSGKYDDLSSFFTMNVIAETYRCVHILDDIGSSRGIWFPSDDCNRLVDPRGTTSVSYQAFISSTLHTRVFLLSNAW